MELDQPARMSASEWSAGWKTRIVTLYQSPWQTCRRRDSDPGDHFVALGGQVKMPGGQVDRFQQVGILAKDSRGVRSGTSTGKAFAPLRCRE